MPRSKVLELFAGIAEQSCKVRKADAVVRMQDWSIATFPAWQEVQIGILSGVTGTPKHVIGSEMVDDAKSEWGVGEWQARLAKIKARSRAKWARCGGCGGGLWAWRVPSSARDRRSSARDRSAW